MHPSLQICRRLLPLRSQPLQLRSQAVRLRSHSLHSRSHSVRLRMDAARWQKQDLSPQQLLYLRNLLPQLRHHLVCELLRYRR